MHYQPALDMSWGPALVFLGLLAFPFVVAWTLLSESVTLYLFKFQRSFWNCVGAAILANLGSGAVGLFWQIFLFDTTGFFYWVNGLVGSPPIDEYQTLSPVTERLGILILLLIGWIGSILLEWAILVFFQMKWGSDKQTHIGHLVWPSFVDSLIINMVSYIGIIAIFLWLN